MGKYGTINYRNDEGKIITKEEFDVLWEEFQTKVDNAYNEKANEILFRINNNATSDFEKLWMLFDYLTSEGMVYDLQGTYGTRAIDEGYQFSDYKTWRIFQHTKYPALINNKGICVTFSLAFEDLSNKLGIPCRLVEGFTGMDHSWNIVLINNEIKHIDIAFAIMYRGTTDKKEFFLKDSLPNRTTTSSIPELERNMREQYAKDHPQFKIISRSDNPSMRIISRSDNNEEEHPQFKITSRSDNPSMRIISRSDINEEEQEITIHKK